MEDEVNWEQKWRKEIVLDQKMWMCETYDIYAY